MKYELIPPLLAYQAASVRGTQPLTGVTVTDTFTDTDGVLIAAHTPDTAPEGSSWSSASTYLSIISNKLVKSATAGIVTTYIDARAFDVKITVTCTNNASESSTMGSGISLRKDGAYYYNVLFNVFTKLFFITSVSTVVASTEIATLAADTPYTLVVTASGPTITATLDGGNEISISNATNKLGATYHGITLQSTGAYADGFQIEGL